MRIVKEAGGSVSISGEMPDNCAILDNPILIPNIELERIFSSEVKDDVTSSINVERVKVVLNLEPSDKTEKSAACTLLESVANFPGFATRAK
ncbi:MAG: hypothetical protein ACYDEX_23860 [Mobilitalea sp.]